MQKQMYVHCRYELMKEKFKPVQIKASTKKKLDIAVNILDEKEYFLIETALAEYLENTVIDGEKLIDLVEMYL